MLNIADNLEQCGQQNIVQCCLFRTGCSCSRTVKARSALLVVPVSLIVSNVYMSNLILFVLFYNR